MAANFESVASVARLLLLAGVVLVFDCAVVSGQQGPLPTWARTDPPEPLGLVVDFMLQQDLSTSASSDRLAARAGVTVREMQAIAGSARSIASTFRTIDRDLPPAPGKIDDSLFRYHRRRQELAAAEITKLKAQIPATAWKSFVAFVIETTAQRENSVRTPVAVRPAAPGGNGQ